MRRIMIAFVVTVAAMSQAHAADQSAAEKQIRQTDQEWVAAVAKKDSNVIAQFYAENGALLAPGAPIAEGRDAVAKAWKGFVGMKDFQLDFKPSNVDVASSGDMAYEIGTYTLSFQGDKGRVKDKGKYVVVWKNTGGVWKVAADIFNSNGGHP